MSADAQHILETAKAAARKAGEIIQDRLGRLDASAIDEKTANDFVTSVDLAAESAIIHHIHKHYPDHRILGEESGQSQSSSDYEWIIDPLDGTTNFVKNIPFYAVSIGIRHREQMIAGVVYNPPSDELFSARYQHGAFLNDIPIKIGNTDDFSRAFLATGFPHHAKAYLSPFMTAFTKIFDDAAGVRRLGAAALDLCYTACGRFDGFWELGLHAWDIAAGSLIIQEAGGVITDFQGEDNHLENGFVIAGNSLIHQHLIKTLSIYFEEINDE